MHGGKFICYVSTTQNKNARWGNHRDAWQRNMVGTGGTQFTETIQSTNASRLNQLFNRAAAALNVRKSDLVCEDIHGNKHFAQSVESGSSAVSQDNPYL